MKDNLQEIRQNNPIIHCITNAVTSNDCANAILAIGASPIMAHHKEEVEGIQENAEALVLNYGATDDYESFLRAGKKANDMGHPIVIDPVGCSASPYRLKALLELLSQVKVACIRGNIAEITSIAMQDCMGKGVDSKLKQQLKEDPQVLATQLAKENNCVIVLSGKINFITDGKGIAEIQGGSALMKEVTGVGCISSALLGAFLAGNKKEDYFFASVMAIDYINECGRIAEDKMKIGSDGPMSFKVKFYDELYLRRDKL